MKDVQLVTQCSRISCGAGEVIEPLKFCFQLLAELQESGKIGRHICRLKIPSILSLAA